MAALLLLRACTVSGKAVVRHSVSADGCAGWRTTIVCSYAVHDCCGETGPNGDPPLQARRPHPPAFRTLVHTCIDLALNCRVMLATLRPRRRVCSLYCDSSRRFALATNPGSCRTVLDKSLAAGAAAASAGAEPRDEAWIWSMLGTRFIVSAVATGG